VHAREAARSGAPPKFEFFSAEQAGEVEAIAARIIPSEETPGAREAGVIFFIDRALATFASDMRTVYAEGLTQLQTKTRDQFPSVQKFSKATPEQQDQILGALENKAAPTARPFATHARKPDFFETLRQHTIAGFLIDPDAKRGSNQDGVGWKFIGREREHAFHPPFGDYDKDYPGWQPRGKEGAS
jgi:gluconate 2-dehydrogenase gamma chain